MNLLESINNQSSHSLIVEVCISDNASTDETEESINIWRDRFNFSILYQGITKILGQIGIICSAINMGTGDYCCWIFGSDDILAKKFLALMERR